MPLDDETWGRVKEAYADATQTVASICAHYDITSWDLYRRRVAGSWPPRNLAAYQRAKPTGKQSIKRCPKPNAKAVRKRKPAPKTHLLPTSGSAGRSLSDTATPAAPITPALIVQRAYKLIDRKLTQMEECMNSEGPETNAADHERQARIITGLAKVMENAVELKAPDDPSALKSADPTADTAGAALKSATGAGPAAASADAARAEQLRREILQRLERILDKRNAPGSTG